MPRLSICRCTSALIVSATLLATLSTPHRAVAQSIGDYRSVASGNWGSVGSWETYAGATWVPAAVAPSSSSGVITIRSGHVVIVAANVTADQIVVDPGGQLGTIKVLTVVNGAGTDLQVNGILQSGDNLELLGGSTAIFSTGAQLIVRSGDFQVKDNSSLTFGSGATATINGGKLKLENSGAATFSGGSLLENWATVDLKDAATVDIDGGTYIEHNNTTIGGTVSITVGAGGVYQHARDGGNILKAGFTTWEAASTCLITGTTGALPDELDHSFYNFTWNAPGQTKNLNLDRKILAIDGTFTVAGTGAYLLSWEQDHDDDFLLGANYTQTGGVFSYTDGNGVGTMEVPGDLSISAGTLLLTSQDGAPTLTVGGDFDLSGGSISETGSGSGAIILDGSSSQLITASGSIINSITVELDNAAGATLTTSLEVPDDLTITSGTLDLASYDLTVGGDLAVAGDLTNPSLLTFDGGTSQSFTYAPGTFTIPSLKVSGAGGVTLGTNLTITTTASLIGAGLSAGASLVTLESGATLLEEGGVFTGNLTFKRDYVVDADGWRMIAAPLAGVNYSSLNGSFHTQGGPWANVVDAESNLRTLNFAAQDWDEIKSADASFTEAEGYIFYMYADDEGGADILPATWTVTGTTQTGNNRSLSFNTTATDSWSLVGNPLTSNLDWDDMVASSTNVGNTYATWDPSLTPGGGLTGYRYYNSASGIGDAGRYIPPFQSFMAQATASGASLAFETSESANAAGANYFGKHAERDVSPHLQLSVEGAGAAETETYLVFDPAATADWDAYDVQRLRPLAEPYVTLLFANDAGPGLAFDARSMESGYEEYSLCVTASEPGSYTLSWPRSQDLPGDWVLELADRETGDVVNLRDRATYQFRIEDGQKGVRNYLASCDQSPTPRFKMRVLDSSRDNAAPWTAIPPADIRVNQNYPNPFSWTTTIRFGVSQDGPVRLDVFDLLGRHVATIVDATLPSGWHEAEWVAGALSSGIYIYRLDAGHSVQTRSMLLQR